jgi:hypothetical protein
MFEQLDDREKAPKVSPAMTLGILAAYLVGAFGGICIFVVLGERAFGIQIASAITYTYFGFWYVFFPTRGLLEQYSLTDRTVQRRIPPAGDPLSVSDPDFCWRDRLVFDEAASVELLVYGTRQEGWTFVCIRPDGLCHRHFLH